MNLQDMSSIIFEISSLKNRGIVLSDFLDTERLLSEFNHISDQQKHGRYVLPKLYSLIKRIQKAVNASLYNNDINLFVHLFSTVEAVRKKLGDQYQIRTEVASKVRDIKRLIESPVESPMTVDES